MDRAFGSQKWSNKAFRDAKNLFHVLTSILPLQRFAKGMEPIASPTGSDALRKVIAGHIQLGSLAIMAVSMGLVTSMARNAGYVFATTLHLRTTKATSLITRAV